MPADAGALGGRCLHEGEHGLGEGGGVAGPDQRAGERLYGLAGAGNIGGEDGEGAGGGFEQGRGQALPARGENEGVGGLEEAVELGLKTEESDPLGEAKTGGELGELGVERAFAGDGQAGGGGQGGHGGQKRGMVLDGFETAGSDPEKLIGEVQLAAHLKAEGRVGTKEFDIDSIGQDVEAGGGDHAGGQVELSGGRADGGDAVGEPGAGRIAEAAAGRAGGGAVETVGEYPDGRGETGAAGQPGGVRQMGVDDVGGFAAEPVVETQPAARVGQALAHVEGKECGSGGGQFGGGDAAGAGEREDGDAPAAAEESMSEKEQLALGSPDAIKTGNDQGDVVHARFPARVESMSSS